MCGLVVGVASPSRNHDVLLVKRWIVGHEVPQAILPQWSSHADAEVVGREVSLSGGPRDASRRGGEAIAGEVTERLARNGVATRVRDHVGRAAQSASILGLVASR